MAEYVGFDTESPTLGPRFRKGRKTPIARAIQDLPLTVGASAGPSVLDITKEAEVREGARRFEVENTSIIDQARAAMPYQGIAGWAIRKANEFDGPADPTFSLKEEDRAGYTEDEQAQLIEARSAEHLSRIKFDIAEEREANDVLGRRGGWYALGASVLAGAPEGILTGSLIAKSLAVAGYGSLAVAQAGNMGKAAGLSVLENVGGNVALTAVEDALGNRISALDYGVAGVTGLIGAAANIPGIRTTGLLALQKREAEAAVRKQMEYAEKALRTLGDDANADSIAKEVARLEADDIRKEVAGATAAVSSDRRLLPDMDKLEADEVAMEPTTQQQAGVPDGPGLSVLPEPGQSAAADQMAQYLEGRKKPNGEAATADDYWAAISRNFTEGGPSAGQWRADTGISFEEAQALPRGVHDFNGTLSKSELEIAKWVHSKFLADTNIIIGKRQASGALHTAVGKDISVIRPGADAADGHLIHELGHAVFIHQTSKIVAKGKAGREAFENFRQLHSEWQSSYISREPVAGDPATTLTRAQRAAIERGGVTSNYTRETMGVKGPANFTASMYDVMAGIVNRVDRDLHEPNVNSRMFAGKYIPNADEFAAEKFRHYVEAAVADALPGVKLSPAKAVVEFFKDLFNTFAAFFNKAKEANMVAPDARAVEFFEQIRKYVRGQETKGELRASGKDPYRDTRKPIPARGQENRAPGLAWLQDPIAVKYGIDLLPMNTPAARAEAKAILELYKRASAPDAPWNNIDPARIDSLTSNNVFDVGSTSLTMLKSENPVVRMIASELIESPSGATGRRSTAAIAKFMHERQYMGNSINDVQDAYKEWRNANGGNMAEDFFGGEKWREFNRLVAEAIENKRTNTGASYSPAVMRAVASLEQAYERMRVAQVDAKTTGWGGLPESSVGYMPHRLSAEAVRNMPLSRRRAFQNALVDQFITIEGWDMSFANELAAKYVDRVNARALGGYSVPANVHQVGAADIVEDALTAMGMSRDEVLAQMKKYMRGAAGHTKGRLQLDLTRQYPDGDGVFTLMDLFETDQINLLRQQAQRVSGEVALSRHGVMGKPGLQLLRRAMEMGDTNLRAQPKEVEAFDQVAAELLGDPIGNYGGKWLNRAMQFTSLARLGGMGFTQVAEFINAATGVGVGKALKGVTSFGRLRSEILDLAAGKQVNNPILGSIEQFGGAQFGTDAYKMVFPFDNPGMQYQVNGADTMTATDRLLRGGLHAQGKLSGWRAIHSVQQRAVAEQIVAKTAEFLNGGKDIDVALRDMGITPDVEQALRAALPSIAKFDGAGKLVEFDITKMEDTQAAFDFVQAVHRGGQQMIQGTFVGETGKWAHDGWLRMLTQFRSFSITSVEKQWARQKSNHGVVTALAILVGSMAAAAPIYMTRMYVQSLGREDQQEWLAQRLEPQAIARATLNYVAMSGLAGDLLDALSATTGIGKSTGGRAGGTTEFVGSVIAPSVGVVDDVWRALQNSKEGTDPHDLAKALPFSKLPVVGVAINALDD